MPGGNIYASERESRKAKAHRSFVRFEELEVPIEHSAHRCGDRDAGQHDERHTPTGQA